MFQFHKVRLKDGTDKAYTVIIMQFQFHKVRLKDPTKYPNGYKDISFNSIRYD